MNRIPVSLFLLELLHRDVGGYAPIEEGTKPFDGVASLSQGGGQLRIVGGHIDAGADTTVVAPTPIERDRSNAVSEPTVLFRCAISMSRRAGSSCGLFTAAWLATNSPSWTTPARLR